VSGNSDPSNLTLCCNFIYHPYTVLQDPTQFADLGFVAIPPRANLFANIYFSLFPTLLFVRVYNALHIHIYPSIAPYTPEHHSFSQVSAFRSFRYYSFISFYTLLYPKCLPLQNPQQHSASLLFSPQASEH
jgi:hypothetical protein